MPYFERKPYDQMIQDVLAPVVAEPTDAPISDLARAVLKSETENRHLLDGPFKCRGKCAPGGSGSIVLRIAAAENAGPVDLTFEADDLHNADGGVIPADRMWVTPESLHLDPGDTMDVTVNLQVPDLAAPGKYQGRLNTFGSEHTGIIVIFDVAADQT